MVADSKLAESIKRVEILEEKQKVYKQIYEEDRKQMNNTSNGNNPVSEELEIVPEIK